MDRPIEIGLMHSFLESDAGKRSPTVLFFDSGVGGLVYLEDFARRNPNISTEYLADGAFFPYGERPPREVEERVPACFDALPKDAAPDIAVLACNTASVVALQRLRGVVSFPVVGVVPAVKPAAAHTKSGHIAILSTNRTANDPYTRDLVRRFARYSRVTALGLPRLVELADRALCTESSLIHEIRTEVLPVLPSSVDTVVLACTHFVRYRRSFQRVLGPYVTVVDSLDGVVRRIESLLDDRGLRSARVGEKTVQKPLFFSTAPIGRESACLENRFAYRQLRVP